MNFTKLFERQEYGNRIKKVQKSMSDNGIDVLISQDPANMNYLTGYNAWSFYYAQCVVLHVNDPEPFIFVRDCDKGGTHLQTYLKDENIIAYDGKNVHNWPKHPYDILVEILKQRHLDKSKIAVEMDASYFTAYCFAKLQNGLPNATFVDSERLVNWVRFVKSDAEIDLMKAAGKIARLGIKKAYEVIRPGVRQCDAVGEIQKALIQGTPEHGGDYGSLVTMVPSGIGTNSSHLTWTDEKFVEDEATIIELCGVNNRYHTPCARTLILGKPTGKQLGVQKMTVEALQAGIDATKNGVTADDVAQAFWKVLDKYGFEKTFRSGYSIGIGYPPDWGEQTMNIIKGDHSVLQTNTCFHLIAVMQFNNWGVEMSESIRVTETGSEQFYQVPQEIFIRQ